MSKAIIEGIRKHYPTPLGSQHDEFLAECAKATGMGLLKKTGGTVVVMGDGTTVAQDILMEVPTGATAPAWDILIDGENTAKPTWNRSDDQPKERFYRVGASQPGPTPPTPTPTPPSHPGYDEGKSIEFGTGCNEALAEAHANPDGGMISVYSQRCSFDYYAAGLPWPDAKKKHLNGFRSEYGLPPL